MEKSTVRDAIIAQLHRNLVLQSNAAHESRDEATSLENKTEGKYDMRSQEAAYLAAGQARFASEIAEAIKTYQTWKLTPFAKGSSIATGELVMLESEDKRAFYFLGPCQGGLEVSLEGQAILVVTPSSPLGRQLIGSHLGKTVKLPGRKRSITYRIAAVY